MAEWRIVLEFIAERVWEQLTPLIHEAARYRAAIAYVGRDAPRMLPLRLGDTIIVDGSEAALAAGTTDPDAVAAWLTSGARVQSLPGLHAKMLLLISETRQVAVVGSANVSAHSRDDLLEAAVVSDDSDLGDQVSNQLDRWAAVADDLDAAWVIRARALFRSDRRPRPRREQRRPQPSRKEPLWVSLYHHDDSALSSAAQRAYKDLQARHGPAVMIWTWRLPAGDEAVVRQGQSVVLLRSDGDDLVWPHGNTIAEPPALVVRVEPGVGDDQPVAFLAYDAEAPASTVRLAAVRRAVQQAGGELSLDKPLPPGSAANAVHNLWTVAALLSEDPQV